MQKIDALPQILVERQVRDEVIKSALSAVFAIGGSSVFFGETPNDANWDRLLDHGYAMVHRFDDGDIKCRIDLFTPVDADLDSNLFALAKALGASIIVDFSSSATSPSFIRYSDEGKKFEKIVEDENASGEVYYSFFRPRQSV